MIFFLFQKNLLNETMNIVSSLALDLLLLVLSFNFSIYLNVFYWFLSFRFDINQIFVILSRSLEQYGSWYRRCSYRFRPLRNLNNHEDSKINWEWLGWEQIWEKAKSGSLKRWAPIIKHKPTWTTSWIVTNLKQVRNNPKWQKYLDWRFEHRCDYKRSIKVNISFTIKWKRKYIKKQLRRAKLASMLNWLTNSSNQGILNWASIHFQIFYLIKIIHNHT